MIILLSWPVILTLVGIWAVFSAICAVIYGIQNSWDDEKAAWLKPFTVKAKWGLFGLLIAIFAGIGAFIYGFIYHNGFAGLFGFLGAIIASVIAANICSPMKWDWESASHPLGVLASLASLLLIVAFAWVFILIAIFRKSTWRLYVGIILAVALFFAGAAGGVAIYQNIELKNTLKDAEEYAASGEYDKALEIYENLNATDLYLQTKYNYGKWYLEQKEYYDALVIFTELAEEHNYSDSAEQILHTNYLRAASFEQEGNPEAAANTYKLIPDYKDATERYQNCCYMAGSENAEHFRSWEDAVSWFQAAGNYKDAPQLAIYYQARMLGQENLMDAQELLRQLPRDFMDTDTMLTAIESYGDWNGNYTLSKSSGKDPQDYTDAELVLVYHRLDFPADAHIKFEVILREGSREYSYYSDGEMPKNGILEFETGSTYQKKFKITKKTIHLVESEPYGSWTDAKKESSYSFERTN